MIINKLILEGFKNHKERTEYDLGKLTYIIGDNYQGKTTIGESITWCLMGSDLTGNERATNRLLNNDSKNMTVTMAFQFEGEEYELIRNRMGTKTSLFLNNEVVKETDLIKFYKEKNIFLSMFVPSYFSGLTPKTAKETLDLVLKKIRNAEVFEVMSEFETELLLNNNFKNPNLFLGDKREQLREIDKDILFLEGFIAAKTEVEEIPNEKIFKGEELEKLKLERKIITDEMKELDNISKPTLSDTNTMQRELDATRRHYMDTLDEFKTLTNVIECPQCNLSIDLDSTSKNRLSVILGNLKKSGQEISVKLEKDIQENKAIEENFNKAIEKNKVKLDKLEDRLKELDSLIILQENIKNSVNENNSHRSILLKLQKESEEKIIKSKAEIELHIKEKEDISLQIDAAREFNQVKLKMQSRSINKYLVDVTIQLDRITKDGELKDDFKILFQGREFVTLSNSERIRAGLEISNLMMAQTKMSIPIFLDNAESITWYQAPDTQLIEARVVKDQELKVRIG